MAAETKARLPGVHENGDIDFPFEFPLSKAIQAPDDSLSVLVLYEPTAQDILDLGLLSGGLYGEQWLKAIHTLTGEGPNDAKRVPEGSLKRMAGKDLLRLTRVLSGFFAQAAD